MCHTNMPRFYVFILTAIPTLIVVILAICYLIRWYMKTCIRWCDSTASLRGRLVVVTGASGGIGLHIAAAAAARGARVVLACRSEARATAAADKLARLPGVDRQRLLYRHLDLTSLASVRDFAHGLLAAESQLDVLINNAGVHTAGDRLTDDGLVEGMQVNYYAPFLLTLLLLPMLKRARGRVVNVSSLCHYRGEFRPELVNCAGRYTATEVYANSKLCMVLFTAELARRLADVGADVAVSACHPGVIRTAIMEDAPLRLRWLFTAWCWFCCRTAEEGAQTPIFLAVAEEAAQARGGYYVDCAPARVWGHAKNQELAMKLWDFTTDVVKCHMEHYARFLK